ncbi:hypothetical protein V9L05_06665 [Bernardetia sp. Wsw4-3y2]|uniref:hypothetical protein n=1 Tax=Bernardetia sp. Wsw4-3y2 TaxID=3127471 RepID=UPI0030D2CF90
MNKSFIFKGFALVNFVILLTAFLLYRNGSFDNFIYNNTKNLLTSPNGGTVTQTTQDSLTIKADTLDVIRFSSSKSMRIFEEVKFEQDTIKTDTTKTDSSKVNLTEKQKHLMYSSKSGRIIDPKLFEVDSLKKEKKSEKKKNKN